jgi:hypothetical protein
MITVRNTVSQTNNLHKNLLFGITNIRIGKCRDIKFI